MRLQDMIEKDQVLMISLFAKEMPFDAGVVMEDRRACAMSYRLYES